ncbi:MAG: flagellar basal body rod modification protein [Cyclobacteriaceae bacterium]
MKNLFLILGAGLVLVLLTKASFEKKEEKPDVPHFNEPPSAIGSEEDPLKRFNFENRQLIDPATGKIPFGIHKREAEFVNKIPSVESGVVRGNFRTKTDDWTLAGPSNVGGRTRALALDILNENIIIAGGVSGGMWRSENAGLSWSRTSHPSVINSTSCVVQDTRPGKESIWYHGTGELRGNSPRASGAPYRGDGIFKSTDGANTWEVLPSTASDLESEFNSPFNYVWNMAINPIRTDIDEVYAAIYGGIIRSQDGGITWQTVLGADLLDLPDDADLNDEAVAFYTNVISTPKGIFYATLSVFTNDGNKPSGKGIFRSSDGNNWVNITPRGFAPFHQRTVMAYAPSDENTVYFLTDNADHFEIWKYNASNGTWNDLSENVPDFEGDLGALDSQEGYNLVIAVHPSDENIVYIGGTNLYRSNDGFTSTNNTSWIGGYDPEGSSNTYEGHHPDQHAMVFYPSNPDKMISANDGGLMTTTSNRATEVSWISLNNGYVTSQFYSISISKQDGSNSIIGGMQDNGTYLKTAPGANQPWNDVFGGDGGYSATTPGDIFWYASFQESQIYRLTLNRQSELTSFGRVDPVGGTGYLFINPYVLDPNNYNRMYLAGGTSFWRNNNLSQVPGGSQEPTTVNWDEIEMPEATTNATALDVSTVPANILYLGTGNGRLFKVDNANVKTPEIALKFNTGGYIVNITIDPSNADKLMALNSNYHVRSIFYSEDGGGTFDDVSGNLEEFPDGSGNGPSTRWSEIIPMQNGGYKYFIGTSSGLFTTDKLDSNNTIWIRAGSNNLGRSVIRMMDYRDSDGKFVVSTHGNGVFETTLANTLKIEKPQDDISTLVVNNSYPNPFSDFVDIEFSIPEEGPLLVNILSSSGQKVKTLLNYPQFAGGVSVRWDGTNTTGEYVKDGMYFYRILYNGKITGGKLLYDRN